MSRRPLFANLETAARLLISKFGGFTRIANGARQAFKIVPDFHQIAIFGASATTRAECGFNNRLAKVHVHPSEPIADGILFDDLHGASITLINRLAARGLVFVTDLRLNRRLYGGTIIARSEAEAELIAFGRGLGEEVVGTLVRAGSLKGSPQ